MEAKNTEIFCIKGRLTKTRNSITINNKIQENKWSINLRNDSNLDKKDRRLGYGYKLRI